MNKPKQKKMNKAEQTRETDALYAAVRTYIEKNNGSVSVVCGVSLVQEVQQVWDYGIMVRVIGQKPIFNRPTK